MTTVAYIHSPICESIILTACKKKKADVAGIIYGRNYKGNFKNCLYLQEDGYANEIGLISYAYIISRFFSKINSTNITLIIPHSYLNLFNLLTAHSDVKKVMYIEEGDAAYNKDLKFEDIEEISGKGFSNNTTSILKQLGFDFSSIDLSKQSFYNNCMGKYVGTIASSENAFRHLPGLKEIVTLERLHIFDRNVGIILFPHVSDLSLHLKNITTEKKMVIDEELIQKSLLLTIIEYIKNIIKNISEYTSEIIIKRHPAANPLYLESVIQNFPLLTNWDDTDLSLRTSGTEVAYINFSHFISIGTSSAIKYAKIAHSAEKNHFSQEINDNEVLEYAFKLYEKLL